MQLDEYRSPGHGKLSTHCFRANLKVTWSLEVCTMSNHFHFFIVAQLTVEYFAAMKFHDWTCTGGTLSQYLWLSSWELPTLSQMCVEAVFIGAWFYTPVTTVKWLEHLNWSGCVSEYFWQYNAQITSYSERKIEGWTGVQLTWSHL